MPTRSLDSIASTALMIRCIDGDHRAFETLLARAGPLIRRFMLRRVHSRDLADDLVQRTLLRVHSSRQLFAEGVNVGIGRSVEAWFMTAAKRTLLDHFRADSRRIARIQRLASHYDTGGFGAPDPLGSPEQIACEAERTLQRRESLRTAMDMLSPTAREIIERHKLIGEPMKGIASDMDIEVATLRVRAHRAYRKLAAALGASPAFSLSSRRNSEQAEQHVRGDPTPPRHRCST